MWLVFRGACEGWLEALIRYAGAEEWYTVSGLPLAKREGGEGHRA
jgi:hypothetical protein